MIGVVAAFFRSWLYTLAGQSIVARLRKDVSGFFKRHNKHCAKSESFPLKISLVNVSKSIDNSEFVHIH